MKTEQDIHFIIKNTNHKKNYLTCKTKPVYQNGTRSKSIRVQNSPDQNQPS